MHKDITGYYRTAKYDRLYGNHSKLSYNTNESETYYYKILPLFDLILWSQCQFKLALSEIYKAYVGTGWSHWRINIDECITAGDLPVTIGEDIPHKHILPQAFPRNRLRLTKIKSRSVLS